MFINRAVPCIPPLATTPLARAAATAAAAAATPMSKTALDIVFGRETDKYTLAAIVGISFLAYRSLRNLYLRWLTLRAHSPLPLFTRLLSGWCGVLKACHGAPPFIAPLRTPRLGTPGSGVLCSGGEACAAHRPRDPRSPAACPAQNR